MLNVKICKTLRLLYTGLYSEIRLRGGGFFGRKGVRKLRLPPPSWILQFQIWKISPNSRGWSCSPQFGKMAKNLVNCTQYQRKELNPNLPTFLSYFIFLNLFLPINWGGGGVFPLPTPPKHALAIVDMWKLIGLAKTSGEN